MWVHLNAFPPVLQLASRLEAAFATNNATSVSQFITGEKSSVSLIAQLDDVACRVSGFKALFLSLLFAYL